jgi:hemin uptake protein HemP
MGEVLTKDKQFPYGLQEEGLRMVDLMREEFSFLPEECKGAPVKTAILFLMRIKVPDDKRDQIIVKDVTNVTPNQNPIIHSVSNSGRMSLFYSSNMNVSTSLELLNPEGKVIFEEEVDYIYGTYHKEVILPQHDNGVYTMRATQSGLVKESRTDVTIF